jgi:hypothetical protein
MFKDAFFMYFYALDDGFRMKLNQIRELHLRNSPWRVVGVCRASKPCQARPSEWRASVGRVPLLLPALARPERNAFVFGLVLIKVFSG